MALPFFFIEPSQISGMITLPEETSKHIVQVLRMQMHETMHLTDGAGNLYLAQIEDANRKKCIVKILETNFQPASAQKITIAISPLKNNNRFEWFLEKATEIGITEIVPLICERTEKHLIKKDRLKNILISAMLQSQQTHMPVLQDPIQFKHFIATVQANKKWIAHCEADIPRIHLMEKLEQSFTDALLLIGPEGDFSVGEIETALQQNYEPVSLGHTRLRTETAGMVGAVLLATARILKK